MSLPMFLMSGVHSLNSRYVGNSTRPCITASLREVKL